MSTEDKIRLAAHGKVRVFITGRKRSAKGFTITMDYGSVVPSRASTDLPSKRIALQFLLAIVRCQPIKTFTLKPKR